MFCSCAASHLRVLLPLALRWGLLFKNSPLSQGVAFLQGLLYHNLLARYCGLLVMETSQISLSFSSHILIARDVALMTRDHQVFALSTLAVALMTRDQQCIPSCKGCCPYDKGSAVYPLLQGPFFSFFGTFRRSPGRSSVGQVLELLDCVL